MMFHDAVAISGARITRDGYLVASARIARTGIQDYVGREVGKPEMPIVKVFRPESEVFAADAMASIAHRPITIDHPPENVSADNWKRLAVGDVGEEVVRDGQSIRVPIKIMDAGAVGIASTTHREFSAGYSCHLDWTPGTFEGQAYDAVQRQISYNHVAAVKAARGGPELRIIDERTTGEPAVATKTITFDGLPIEATDAAEAVIRKLEGQLTAAVTTRDAAAGQVTALSAAVATRDGEVAALKSQLADAAVTPAKLTALVAARAAVIDAAKLIVPTLVTDGKTDAEIKRAAVAVKLGDAAATMADATVDGAFAAFTAAAPAADPLRRVIGDGVANIGDAKTKADAAHAARNQSLRDGYKTPVAA